MASSTAAAELAAEVACAARRGGAARTLLLDVDGTLAPIAPTPEQAAVPPAIRHSLARLLGQGWTVAAVSGRAAAGVRSMLPVPGLQIFGSHGVEGALPDGRPAVETPPELGRRLARLHRSAQRCATRHPGVRVERKPAGLALHDRALPSRRLRAWHRELDDWLRGQPLEGLDVLRGKRVVELRPRGAHKGRVVRGFAAALGLREEDRSFVAVGDDVTDEDMFREIRGFGLGVRVGRPGVATHAARRLASPAQVARFLAALSARGSRG